LTVRQRSNTKWLSGLVNERALFSLEPFRRKAARSFAGGALLKFGNAKQLFSLLLVIQLFNDFFAKEIQ